MQPVTKTTHAVTFSVTAAAEIALRTPPRNANGQERGRSAIINNLVERMCEVYRIERLRMRQIFTNDELALIIRATSGTLFDTRSVTYLHIGIADAMALNPGMLEDLDVAPALLNQKMSKLDYAQKAALVDALERWWGDVGAGLSPSTVILP